MLALEPLSRELNKISKVKCGNMELNHITYMDDIKLLSTTESGLVEGKLLTEKILTKISLHINSNKSGALDNIQSPEAREIISIPLINQNTTYKYLGLPQSNIVDQKSSKQRIITEFSERAATISTTKLNFINLRTAMNETCVSLINYTTGILEWSQNELKEFNNVIIKTLKAMKYQERSSNIDRVFLSKELGGLGFRALPQVHNSQVLRMGERIEARGTENLILLHEMGPKIPTILSKVHSNLKKMFLVTEGEGLITVEEYKKTYSDGILDKVKEKKLHNTYFVGRNQSCVDKKASNAWLEKTETSPKVASKLVALQDRTMFLNRMRDKDGFKTCPMCNMRKVCIDHLATKCWIGTTNADMITLPKWDILASVLNLGFWTEEVRF